MRCAPPDLFTPPAPLLKIIIIAKSENAPQRALFTRRFCGACHVVHASAALLRAAQRAARRRARAARAPPRRHKCRKKNACAPARGTRRQLRKTVVSCACLLRLLRLPAPRRAPLLSPARCRASAFHFSRRQRARASRRRRRLLCRAVIIAITPLFLLFLSPHLFSPARVHLLLLRPFSPPITGHCLFSFSATTTTTITLTVTEIREEQAVVE